MPIRTRRFATGAVPSRRPFNTTMVPRGNRNEIVPRTGFGLVVGGTTGAAVGTVVGCALSMVSGFACALAVLGVRNSISTFVNERAACVMLVLVASIQAAVVALVPPTSG